MTDAELAKYITELVIKRLDAMAPGVKEQIRRGLEEARAGERIQAALAEMAAHEHDEPFTAEDEFAELLEQNNAPWRSKAVQ